MYIYKKNLTIYSILYANIIILPQYMFVICIYELIYVCILFKYLKHKKQPRNLERTKEFNRGRKEN